MNQRLLTGILGFADPACCTVPITGCSPYAADCTGRLTSVTALPRETLRPAAPVRLHPWSVLLRLTALALAGVGITMNGWYSRSLGSTEAAGYLFLAVGVAADAVALCLPRPRVAGSPASHGGGRVAGLGHNVRFRRNGRDWLWQREHFRSSTLARRRSVKT